MNDSTTPTTDILSPADQTASAADATAQPAPAAEANGFESEQPSENNPLKRFQDLINSPTTPDGHKVVAAVAAASTVTVAAVANWLMRTPKK